MKLLFCLLFPVSLTAGCTQSTPANAPQPTQIYVQPMQPIHQSLIRTRQSSASFSDSEGEAETIRLRTAILAVRRCQEARLQEECKEVKIANDTTSSTIKRRRSSQPGLEID